MTGMTGGGGGGGDWIWDSKNTKQCENKQSKLRQKYQKKIC